MLIVLFDIVFHDTILLTSNTSLFYDRLSPHCRHLADASLALSFADVYLQVAGAFLFGLLLVARLRTPSPEAAAASHARLDH